MSSAASSYGRSRSGDRFYNPPQVRRQLQLQQQQQLLLQKQKQPEITVDKNQQQRRQKPAKQPAKSSCVSAPDSVENRPESDDCASTTTTTPAASVSSYSTSVSNSTNLDRFLEYTTPVVPAQCFSKMSMKGWRSQEDDFRSYFVLGDLWESFKEWSAYGAGVPLLLNGSDSVVQYYVPYLSGIQLYIDPSKPALRARKLGEESDESSRETSSEGSSDCEIEKRASSFGIWSQNELGEPTLQDMKGLSGWNKPFNGSSSDDGESNSPGVLVFEYFEHDNPFSREPLADKITILASRFPELKTYRSCDLSPSSWISVAWYPIYRIPTGPTLQNLESCFLTFHSLSTPIGAQNEWQCHYSSCPMEVPSAFDMAPKLSLPIFGMACYKFRISVWDQNGVDECQRANILLRAADEWLRLLNVNHPDYKFFVSKNFYWR